jgi:FkbM family methyltransferase
MVKKLIAKALLLIFKGLINLLARNTKDEARLLNKIIGIANYNLGRGFSGPKTLEDEIQRLTKYFNQNDYLTLIDGGAHQGLYSDSFKRIFPNSKIYCFEPSKDNFDILKNKFRSSNDISVLNYGLSNKTSQGELFYDKEGSSMSSLYRRRLDHFQIDFKKNEKIDLIDLESFWRKNLNNKDIDILKLDIEGNELLALEGCGDLINKIKVIQFEFGGCNIDSRTYFQDFWYFFAERNFTINRVTPYGLVNISEYSEIEEHFRTTVFLASNNNILKK